jgi:hypothetical protein
MESRYANAPEEEELDVLAKGWKIGVPIRYPCEVMAEG